MKLNFFEYLLLFINGMLLFFQLMLMGTFPSFFDFSVLNLFVPIVVLINLFFFLYWLLKMKWPFLLFMLCFLMGYSQWGLLYQFPKNSLRKSSSSFSVMSYNVRLFNKYNWLKNVDVPTKIEELIMKEQPDIVCFQEYSKTESPRLEAYPYKYIQPSRAEGKSQLALFSKFPILNQGYIAFEASSNGGAFIDVSYQGKKFRVYNLHLESLRINIQDSILSNPDSEAIQLKFNQVFKKQLDQLVVYEEINKLNELPSVICTDLNNSQFSKTYDRLASDKQDAFTTAGEGLGTTFHFSFFPLRIDFIFADESFAVNEFSSLEVKLSDHYPIISRLGWK